MAVIYFSQNKSDGILTERGYLTIVNGTIIELQNPYKRFEDTDLNELLYVVVVIMFYAIALMIMIGTQIRNSRRDGREVDYYNEYLVRAKEVCELQRRQLSVQKVRDMHTACQLDSIQDEEV